MSVRCVDGCGRVLVGLMEWAMVSRASIKWEISLVDHQGKLSQIIVIIQAKSDD